MNFLWRSIAIGTVLNGLFYYTEIQIKLYDWTLSSNIASFDAIFWTSVDRKHFDLYAFDYMRIIEYNIKWDSQFGFQWANERLWRDAFFRAVQFCKLVRVSWWNLLIYV